MAVDSVSAAGNPWRNTSASNKASNAAEMNYDSFLKLLITQMKNQDPTDPMDASEQVAQLATFSQVEQTIQTNTNLESMLQAEALTRGADLVGKYVKSADESVMGIVKQVEVYSDGMIAITQDDKKVLIQTGVVFSNEPIKNKLTSDSAQTS